MYMLPEADNKTYKLIKLMFPHIIRRYTIHVHVCISKLHWTGPMCMNIHVCIQY